MSRILFVTWDGPQVNYVESLFVPIFRALGAEGIHFDIVQFRWGSQDSAEPLRRACADAGIGLRLHRILRRGGGAGAMATAITGTRHVRNAAAAFGSDILMPRSLMPALALLAGRRWQQPIIFDADGLPADERVEFAGLGPDSMTYRLLREIEATMLRRSDRVIVRTEAARQILLARAGPTMTSDRIHIVINGRDHEHFAPLPADCRAAIRAKLGVGPDTPLLVYAGSMGTQYRLSDSIMLLAEVRRRRPDAMLLILTGSPELVAGQLEPLGTSQEGNIVVRKVPPLKVAELVASADAATAYRDPGYSMQAVSPVKVGEYLLCGTPVVGTAAIGNVKNAVDAGVFRDEAGGHAAAADWIIDHIMNNTRQRAVARDVGIGHFSLQKAAESYQDAISAALAHRK
jgi:glycosyltransferase involved in cell wall biosynthesis